MKRGFTMSILVALLLAVAACGGAKDEPAPAASEAPAAATQTVVQPQQPAAAAATPVPPTATPVPPAATPELEDELPAELAALENLDSFRLLMTYTATGTDADGKAVDDRTEILTEFTKDPEARRMLMTFVGDSAGEDGEPQSMETYQIGQDMYMSLGEDVGWMRVATDDSPLESGMLGILSRDDIFGNLNDLKRVRPDQRINGVDSRHYQFDERALSAVVQAFGSDITAKGDIWVAKDGGYVTKYVLTMQLKDNSQTGALGGILVDGAVEMAYEVKDVNTNFTIELPDDITAGSTLAGFEGQTFPLPEGSRIQAASPEFTMIEADAPGGEVAAFYEEALSGLGWTKDEQGAMSFGDMTSLTFTKDGKQLTLVINADPQTGKTQVMASVQ